MTISCQIVTNLLTVSSSLEMKDDISETWCE